MSSMLQRRQATPTQVEDITYKKVGVRDDEEEDITAIFDECLQFIHQARTAQKGVLVHCMAGISRSATIVLAYLMKHENMRLLDAYWHTHDRRKIICPNGGFAMQLIEYEKKLYGCTTLDSCYWPVERRTAAEVLKEREERERTRGRVNWRLRPGDPDKDAQGIYDIYIYYVENTVASFEVDPPSVEELRDRLKKVSGLVVAVEEETPDATAPADEKSTPAEEKKGGRILGFAYFSAFRDREAYWPSCENTVYVHKDMHRKGVGRALLSSILIAARQAGKSEIVAAIADPNGEGRPSVALHTALGYSHVGTFQRVGQKLFRRVDVAFYQRSLEF